MGFYEKWILPRLVDVAMRNRVAMRYRSQVVPQARGKVLEIGVGSGLPDGFGVYSPAATWRLNCASKKIDALVFHQMVMPKRASSGTAIA